MTQLDPAPLAPVDSAPLSAPASTVTPLVCSKCGYRCELEGITEGECCGVEMVPGSFLVPPVELSGGGRRPRSDKGKPREQLTLSTSEGAVLAACPTKYFNGYELGRYASVEEKEAAEWGLYVHRSLAQFYRALRHGWGLSTGWHLAMRQIDRKGVDGGRRPYYPPADPYARAMLRAVVHSYLVVWGPEDERDYEVVAVEKRYLLPALRPDGTHRRGFNVDGVLDLARRNRKTGRVWIADHKTTTSDFEKTDRDGNRTYFLNAPVNPQAIGYVDVAHRLGWEPEGFEFDVIKRPGLAKYEKPERGESADDFEARMIKTITEGVEIDGKLKGGPERYFARFPVTYQDWQINKARSNVIARGEEVLWRRRTGYWPQNDDACGKFGSTCPWMPVCTGRESATDDRLFPLKKKEGQDK